MFISYSWHKININSTENNLCGIWNPIDIIGGYLENKNKKEKPNEKEKHEFARTQQS